MTNQKTKEDHEALPEHLKRALNIVAGWDDVVLVFTRSDLGTYGRFSPEAGEKALQELCELGWMKEHNYMKQWFSYASQPYILTDEARPYLRTIWRTVR